MYDLWSSQFRHRVIIQSTSPKRFSRPLKSNKATVSHRKPNKQSLFPQQLNPAFEPGRPVRRAIGEWETPSAGIRTIELVLGEWRADAGISPTLWHACRYGDGRGTKNGCWIAYQQPSSRRAPPVGLEPTTRRLTAACSTNWATGEW